MKMNKRIEKILITMMVALMMSVSAISVSAAGKVSVKAKLDSVQLLMGNITMLNVEVVADKGTKGGFPMLDRLRDSEVITLLGDSVEIRGISEADTIDLGSGRVQMNFKMPLQSFDSGLYHLPPIEYVAGKDTFVSNRVVLKVIPVPVGENDEISGYMPPVEPSDASIFDYLPDFFVYYWWIILLSILMVAAIVYFILRRKRNQPLLGRRQKQLLPHEVALQELQQLRERKLWEQGLEREYFTQLTEILRRYLDGRFGINAMEMTSRDIILKLSENKDVKDKREYVRQILDVADFVKFAKMRPLPSDSVAAFENAIKFVEETKPEDESEDDEESSHKDGKEVKK